MSDHIRVFLKSLSDRGVKLRCEDSQLHLRAPKGVLSGEDQQQLRAMKDEIVALLEASQKPPLRVELRQERPQLSSAQARLWLLDGLFQLGSAYHIAMGIDIEGPLDVASWQAAFAHMIARHEILRTTFASHQGEPFQVIGNREAIQIECQDLSRQHWSRQQDAAIAAPMDLEKGPLLRAFLWRESPTRARFFLVIHHILCDGWSVAIMVREMTACYKQLVQGQQPNLAPLAMQYADFAASQNAHGHDKADLDWWREELQGAPSSMALPRKAPVQPRPLATLQFHLDRRRQAELQDLARGCDSNLFAVLISAYGVMLHHFSADRDMVIGVPEANRPHLVLESMIGFFVNTLPTRLRLHHGDRCQDLMKRTHARFRAAQSRAQVPFEKIVEALALPRDKQSTPLFQVFFALQNMPRETLQVDDLQFKPVPIQAKHAKFDLYLDLVEEADGIHARLEYDGALFDRDQAEAMVICYQEVLEQFLKQPEQHIADLDLLPAPTRLNLIHHLQGPRNRAQGLLFDAFLGQCQQDPQAEAIRCGSESWTYAELAHNALAIRNGLRNQGLQVGQVVGICLSRTPWMVASVLGVLQAGGCYLPLDPAYPPARIRACLQDSGAGFLLSDPQSQPKDSDWGQSVEVIDPRQLKGVAEQPFIAALQAAYLIYTSGSTGRPKGVCLSHRAGSAMIYWATQTLTRHDLAQTLASTSLCFDVSVFEIIATLSSGGCLHLVDNALSLMDLPTKAVLTAVNVTPTVLGELLHIRALPAGLRVINLAGETLSDARVRAVRAACPQVRIFNHYGPTEANYASSSLVGSEPVTIGLPIHGASAYILNDFGQLLPKGVCGDLYLAGRALARGYHDQPALTASRFVPDPFSGLPGSRMYRSGDRARLNQTGQIEYLGRLDQQIKLRGYRIELEEVEAALQKLPGVSLAAAKIADCGNGPTLIGYLQADQLDCDQAIGLLQQQLPHFMVPASLVVMAHLPKTPNQKIDRQGLPLPNLEVKNLSPPRNQLETQMGAIWSEVLRHKAVGIYDNFFDLGGHSLLAARMIARLNEALHSQLAIADILNHPTIAALAERIDERYHQCQGEQEEPLSTQWLPLVSGQHFFFKVMTDYERGSMDPPMISADFPLIIPELEAAMRQVIAQHDALRLRFRHFEGRWQQRVAAVDEADLIEIVDLSHCHRSQQETVLQQAFLREGVRFSLERGPLFKVVIYMRGTHQPPMISFLIHHLVVDGFSLDIVMRDLQNAYFQRLKGEVMQLPPRTTSFARWALFINDYGRSEALAQQLPYWSDPRRLRVPRLPRDVAYDGADMERAGRSHQAQLSKEATERLLALGHRHGDGERDLILAALMSVIHHMSGHDCYLVNMVNSGRSKVFPQINLSRTVGWLSIGYPMLYWSPQKGDVRDWFRAIQDQDRDLPDKGLGYSPLCDFHPNPLARKLTDMPRAELLFNYLGDQGDRARTFEASSDPLPDPTPEMILEMGDDAQTRPFPLHLEMAINEGVLHWKWCFSLLHYSRATIETLASQTLNQLEILMVHLSPESHVGAPA